MLLDAIKMQVETRLESSLHNRVYIIPDKNQDPTQVEHPWSIDVKSGSKPTFRLPKNTHIITVYDQSKVGGRLLILGKPGAGKTTMLLELAKELVQRAEHDLSEPVPVLLSLASWQNDQQSIADWIVAELNSGKYYKVHKNIAKQWLEEGEIIPLLDGLDELAAARQESCVQKINEFLQPGKGCYPLVVCSRIEEYQVYSTQLELNTSIELNPFSEEQIQEYLQRTGNDQLWNDIKDDRELIELAQTPFLLNVIVLSCQKLSLAKWQELTSPAERQNALFSAYVEEMLSRKYQGNRPGDEEKTKRWLGWLAGKLIVHNQIEFFIETLQPFLLGNAKQKQIYRLIVWLISTLLIDLNFIWNQRLMIEMGDGLFNPIIEKHFSELIICLVGGIIAYHFAKRETIRTFEIPQIDWKKILNISLMGGLMGGLVGGLGGGLVGALKGGVKAGLAGILKGGLIFGLMLGVLVGLMAGVKSVKIETKTSPNQGIWKTFQNAVIIELSVGLFCGLIFGLIFGRDGRLFGWLGVGLNGVLFYVLIIAQACIKHLSLRLILYFNGYIPWNYARFLDYATDRLFLQRVGGGYRFMHDLLRQHFAANYR